MPLHGYYWSEHLQPILTLEGELGLRALGTTERRQPCECDNSGCCCLGTRIGFHSLTSFQQPFIGIRQDKGTGT